LRTSAAADYLSIRPNQLRRLVAEGQLPVVRLGEGAPFLFDRRDLDALVERNKTVFP
jgi:excisionase family DNA binding protein